MAHRTLQQMQAGFQRTANRVHSHPTLAPVPTIPRNLALNLDADGFLDGSRNSVGDAFHLLFGFGFHHDAR